MALNRNDQPINPYADKALLLELEKIELRTEQYRTEVKQLQLKIAIETDSDKPKHELIEKLQLELETLMQIENLEIKWSALFAKIEKERLSNDGSAEQILAIEAKITGLCKDNRFAFRLTDQAKDLLLCVAAYYGLNQTMDFLLKNGAKVDAVVDSRKHYPASLDTGIPHLFNQLKVGKELFPRLKMEPKLVNNYPLELALSGEHFTTAETLIAANAPINATFNHKPSLKLMWAQHPPTLLFAKAEQGDLAAVDFLIQHGAHLDATDKNGNTALHRAAWGDHMAVVQSLLQAKADPNIKAKGNGNKTAADLESPTIKAVIKAYQDRNCVASCSIM